MVPSVWSAGRALFLSGPIDWIGRSRHPIRAWLEQVVLPAPLVFLLMVGVATATTSGFAALYEAHRIQNAAHDDAQRLARQMALMADNHLTDGRIDLLQQDLATALAADPQVLEVVVLDSGGHVLARASRASWIPGTVLTASSQTLTGSVRVTERPLDSSVRSGFTTVLLGLDAIVLAFALLLAARLARESYRPVRRFAQLVSSLTVEHFNAEPPRLDDRMLQPVLDRLWRMGSAVTARERELAAQNAVWQRRYGQARALIDLMAEFNQVMVFRAVLERLSLGLSRFFAGDAVAMWIFDPSHGNLELAAEVAGSFPRQIPGNDPWAQQVLLAGESRFACPWFKDTLPAMAAPLLDAEGRTIGIIMLTSTRRAEYTSEEYAFLRTVIAHAAMAIRNAAVYELTDALSRRDALTGLFNRREFDRLLGHELARGLQAQEPLALLMVDIDNFKRVNDERGHQAGDAALKQLATLIQLVPVRANDAAFRLGGEEFAILLTQTDKSAALAKAEYLRRVTEGTVVLDQDSRLTVSVGVATFPDDGQDPSQLMAQADRALYRAKNAGRNRVQAA